MWSLWGRVSGRASVQCGCRPEDGAPICVLDKQEVTASLVLGECLSLGSQIVAWWVTLDWDWNPSAWNGLKICGWGQSNNISWHIFMLLSTVGDVQFIVFFRLLIIQLFFWLLIIQLLYSDIQAGPKEKKKGKLKENFLNNFKDQH